VVWEEIEKVMYRYLGFRLFAHDFFNYTIRLVKTSFAGHARPSRTYHPYPWSDELEPYPYDPLRAREFWKRRDAKKDSKLKCGIYSMLVRLLK